MTNKRHSGYRSQSVKARIKRAEKAAAERRIRRYDKTVAKQPEAVAEYLATLSVYIEALTLAIEVRRRGRFSPESVPFVKGRHTMIRKLLDEWGSL